MQKMLFYFLIYLVLTHGSIYLDPTGAGRSPAGATEHDEDWLKDPPSGELLASQFKWIIVIPDTHGDFEASVASVFSAYRAIVGKTAGRGLEGLQDKFEDFKDWILQLIEEMNRVERVYAPREFVSDTAVIQLGDLVDIGPESKKCIDLFEVLPSLFGWEVIKLCGDHDLMSILSKPKIAGVLNPDDSKTKIREVDQEKTQFNEEANIKYREPEFRGPDRIYYQRYLDSYLGMARLTSDRDPSTNTLFVHGGIELEWFRSLFEKKEFSSLGFEPRQSSMRNKGDIDRFNKGLKHFLAQKQRVVDRVKVEQADNPEQTKFFSSIFSTHEVSDEMDVRTCEIVAETLEYFNVARIIVGHTPQETRIPKILCEGKFIVLDVAMSGWVLNSAEKGLSKPVALLMEMGRTESIMNIVASTYSIESGIVGFDSAVPIARDLGIKDLPNGELLAGDFE
jgi:hypothetical protein